MLLKAIIMRRLFIGLAFSFLSIETASSALPTKALPNHMVVYINQQQTQVVHANGSTDPNIVMIGDVVSTTGVLKDSNNSSVIGNYWTQKTVIGMNGQNAVRTNLVYYNITSQTNPKLNGTLYVEGVNETSPGSTHAAATLRPIIGGTASFAAARGTAEAVAQEGSNTVIKVTFTFYK